MNAKNFLIGGIVGGIIQFFMGWLIYGLWLKDTFPKPKDAGPDNLLFIFLGCLFYAFVFSYIFNRGEKIVKCVEGIKTALIVSLLIALCMNFFNNMYSQTIDVKIVALDVITTMFISVFIGASIAVINGKLK